MTDFKYPSSPKEKLEDIPYFPRLCEKIRLHGAGTLHPELHENLGHGMDLWTCQFLGIDYEDLKKEVLDGADNLTALAWAKRCGTPRNDEETAWFTSYILNRGFRDDLSDKLAARKKESGFEDRDEILSFADYIDADEGRMS